MKSGEISQKRMPLEVKLIGKIHALRTHMLASDQIQVQFQAS
jgi:hypothetical protein